MIANIGFALVFAALVTATITAMPAAPDWHDQAAYEKVFGLAPRRRGRSTGRLG